MRHLYIISDLHLGGAPDAPDAPGSQICNAYAELASFIGWISSREASPHGPTELVVNGDFVDFFAVDALGARAWNSDAAEAIARLDAVRRRAEVVFRAFAEFTAAGHRLTVLLGNHDVELSMPKVRAHFLSMLGDPDRIRFVYDGEAYTVGRVLVEHGNRYDRWNVVDHSRLRQERSVASRGLPIDESLRKGRFFMPPAGSHLVVRVMNRIKSRYRFVDLLKPETASVLPLLLALEPDHRVALDDALTAGNIAWKLGGHGHTSAATPASAGDLSSASGDGLSLDHELWRELGADLDAFRDEVRGFETSGEDLSVDDDLRRVARWLTATADALSEGARSLTRVLDMISERDDDQRRRKLLVALRHLNATDASFDTARELPAYRDAAAELAKGGEFDLVVFGHTHLPKDLPLPREVRPARYLNTGTWVDVMRLPSAITGDDEKAAQATLDEFLEAIRRNDFAPYVRRYLSYAEVVLSDDGSVLDAAVRSFDGVANSRAPMLTDTGPNRGNDAPSDARST